MEANYIVKYSYKEQCWGSPTGYAWHTVQMPFNSIEDARQYKKEVELYYKNRAFLLCNSETTRSGLNDEYAYANSAVGRGEADWFLSEGF